ncbi:hypothetical protein ACJJTC_012795 [Scirpophaga incertulas]
MSEVARTRSDDVAKAVIARIEYEFDLVAAEAKYHDNCYNIFLRPTTGHKVGRPEDDLYGTKNRKQNRNEERFRVLKAAAAIIREDIQSVVIDEDNYPPAESNVRKY